MKYGVILSINKSHVHWAIQLLFEYVQGRTSLVIKMEVTDEVLEKLKCAYCANYLSCGPVLMLDNERIRCGRCLKPEGGIRNKPYEELAKLMTFPCRYKENGCEEKLRFEENKQHEEVCMHKLYVCPIAESGKCDWSGLRGNLLEHCKTKHPANVIENPVKFKHDITGYSFGNYLLFAYQLLFQVQTKVCTVTRKIYYSVRLFGDPKLAVKYSYDIEIYNENDKLVKHGKVAPEGRLGIHENTSMALDIIGLLAVLGGFKDTLFKLTVRSIDKEAEKKVTTVETKKPKRKNKKPTTTGNDTKETKIQVMCAQCKSMTAPVYQDWDGWKCKPCGRVATPTLCKFSPQGCAYRDYKFKCMTHEMYYCSYSIRCELCESSISDVCLNDHYIQAHGDITFMNGQVCFEGRFLYWEQQFIVKSMFGNLICSVANCGLHIRSPLPSEQLYMYRCVIKLTEKQTGHATVAYGNVYYNYLSDWFLYMPDVLTNIKLFSQTFTLKIHLIKIR